MFRIFTISIAEYRVQILFDLHISRISHSVALRCKSFSEKNVEKKHLCRHDKNYYYLCKSNILLINLIVGSRNMIKVSKISVCKKLDKQLELFLPNTENFLTFFIVFEWSRILIMNKITRSFISMEKLITQDLKTLWTNILISFTWDHFKMIFENDFENNDLRWKRSKY